MKKTTLQCYYSTEKKQYVFYWSKSDREMRYCLEGVAKNFVYDMLLTTTECSCVLPVELCQNYSSFRIKCFDLDLQREKGDLVLAGVSNFTELPPVPAVIDIKAVRSYEGISLSFQSDEIFDEYNLFKVKGEEKKLLLSSAVPCVHSSLVEEGADYYVEGVRYTEKEKGERTLFCVARSAVTRCSPMLAERPSEKVQLSVIVPVYNIAWLLPRTLDAAVCSTVQNLELILVDDGSTDGSAAVCDWYAANYAFVKVIHTENQGVAHARNVGMDEAKGEFLAFLDSDDVVHPFMYERLLRAAEEQHSDIAVAQIFVLNYNDVIQSKHLIYFKNIFGKGDNITCKNYREMMSGDGDPNGYFVDMVWNRIVRRDVARKVRFRENLQLFEDCAYTSSLYSYIDKFVFVRNAYYVWDRHIQKTVGSLSGRATEACMQNWQDEFVAFVAVLSDGNPDPKVSEIYKLSVLRRLLRRYPLPNRNINRLFAAMLKYYVAKYQLPVEKLGISLGESDHQKIYDNWLTVSKIAVQPFDGYGKIPDDIMGKSV